MGTPRSLILVTVDCFRADHAGFLGYKRNTTPFLDSIAESSTIFTNAIVAGAPTYYSLPAIMSSRYPLALGRDVIGIAPGETTIASALRHEGYATAAFLAANPYLSAQFGYDVGFDTFHDFLQGNAGLSPDSISDSGKAPHRSRLNSCLARVCHSFAPAGKLYDEFYFHYCQAIATRGPLSLDALRRFPSADVIVDESIAWPESLTAKPFFLWLHFMDPHFPYYPKEEALAWMANDSDGVRAFKANSQWNREEINTSRLRHRINDITALYDAGIRWVDGQLRRLVDELRRRKMWDECVLAVTADHGEEFLDHGGRQHSPRKLTEELIHVPLLIHGPEVPKKNIYTAPFSLVDLAPTLLASLQVSVPAAFRGSSLWSRPIAHNGIGLAITEAVATCKNPFEPKQRLGSRIIAIREADFKLVLDYTSSEISLFNLRTDPGELLPLPEDAEKPVRRRLLQRAKQHVTDSLETRPLHERLDSILRDIRLESC